PARHAPLLTLAARCGLRALGGLVRRLLGLFLAHVRPFSSLLRLRRGLLLARDGLAWFAAGARARARARAAHRERLAVAQPSVGADLLEALDVQRDLATEITLDRELPVDDLTDLGDLGFGEVPHADRVVHARLVEHLARVRRSD